MGITAHLLRYRLEGNAYRQRLTDRRTGQRRPQPPEIERAVWEAAGIHYMDFNQRFSLMNCEPIRLWIRSA